MSVDTNERGDPDVRLRPVALRDVDAIMGWINDPEITRNFAGFGEPVTRAAEEAFIARMIASPNDRLFAIVDRADLAIGTAGVHSIYWPARNGRLGIMLGRHRGRGLGRRALGLLIAEAFDTLDLHKVWIVHFPDNARMAHLCAAFGFRVEGVLRDEYFHRDRHWDMIRQSLLSHERVAVPPTS
jgi:diamine N-acetyltransferase